MNAMKILLLVLGIFLLLLGLTFLIASTDNNFLPRLIAGVCMILTGAFLVRKSIHEQKDRTVFITRDLELTGDVGLEDLTCDKCGAGLSSENVSVKAGAVFVACPYCRTEYQIEEKPKW